MKKKFTIGLIALLSVSFIFFSCGDSGGGGSSGGPATINGSDLSSITIVPYAGVPTGAAVSATIEISDTIAGTVALATYTDVDTSGGFTAGDTQVITITLTAAGGFTFADTDITPADVVANVLNPTAFPALDLGTPEFDGDPGVTLVVKVTYIVPVAGPSPLTKIEAADLTGIEKYNVAPTGAAVGDTAFNTGNPGFTGTVALATGSVAAAGPSDSIFDEGDTQVITITLTAAGGYTFTGTAITDADAVVAAVLNTTAFPTAALSLAAIDGTPGDTLVVNVTYTVLGSTPPPETDVKIVAGDLSVITGKYNTAPDGNAVTSPAGDLVLSAETIIASGLVELAEGSVNLGANPSVFDEGDTQVVTITLTAAEGYTFTETAITPADVVSAALGSNVTVGLGSPSVDGTPGDTLVVKATYTVPDTTDPVVGGGGTLTPSDATTNGFTVSWTVANDNVSAAEDLKYFVYTKTGSTFTGDTAAAIKSEGQVFNDGGTANIITQAITGLNPATEYFFAVIVVDKAGNEAAYTKGSQMTVSLAAEAKATLEAAGLTNITVTDPTTLTLTNDNATVTTVTIPGTITLDLSTYSITLDSSAVLTIENPAKILGTGKIIADAGSITIGEVEEYTTDGGVVANDLTTLVAAFEGDFVTLAATVTLAGSLTPGEALGSVTLIDNSTPVAVTDSTTGSGGSAIEITDGIEFVGTVLVSTSYTLSLNSGALEVVDTAFDGSTPEYATLTFTGLQLKKSGLVSPVVPNFNIGTVSSRN
jgi:hypothetical protein